MNITGTVDSVLNLKSDHLWSIPPETTVFDAIQLMADKNIGALLVTKDGKLTGVFSERDYTRKIALKGKSSKQTPVGEVVSTPIISAGPGSSVEECMRLMTEHRVRHLPVLNGQELIGIVSIGDLVNWTISAQHVALNQMADYISGKISGVNAILPFKLWNAIWNAFRLTIDASIIGLGLLAGCYLIYLGINTGVKYWPLFLLKPESMLVSNVENRNGRRILPDYVATGTVEGFPTPVSVMLYEPQFRKLRPGDTLAVHHLASESGTEWVNAKIIETSRPIFNVWGFHFCWHLLVGLPITAYYSFVILRRFKPAPPTRLPSEAKMPESPG